MSSQDTGPAWVKEHIALYRSDPEKAHMWDSAVAGRTDGIIATLLLTTRGRKTGNPVYSPLIYGEDAKGYVVVGSKGGAPEHPAWYLNLQADPECEIQVGAKHFHARARTTEGEERARLWALMQTIYSHYGDFQDRTGGREFPVILLEPKD